jgi:uncharacterized membrane protein YeaQ/YmgE (transglycosylase-associated protein family)
METLWGILTWMVFGLIAGAIARFLVPGRQAIGLLGTMVLGIIGSLLGGGLTWLVTRNPLEPAGMLMSILGAVIVLVIAEKTRSRQLT